MPKYWPDTRNRDDGETGDWGSGPATRVRFRATSRLRCFLPRLFDAWRLAGQVGHRQLSCILYKYAYVLRGIHAEHTDIVSSGLLCFNHRDIDSALALMSENVSWPKASEGGRVVGKEEIRSYWTRQWKEFDPHVEPLEVIDHEGGITEVKVHQLVKSLEAMSFPIARCGTSYTIANASSNAWT